MKRKASIIALLKKCEVEAHKLKTSYESCLSQKAVSEDLKIEIKGIFEHLRSSLDYLAHEIFDSSCSPESKPRKLYFPISGSESEFAKCMHKNYPGLESNNKALFNYLESIQPYKVAWLGHFNKLNNDNKHNDLVEQTKLEERHVSVSSSSGGSVSWGPGVSFGGVIHVMGVPIDPVTQLPVPNNLVTTKVTIWTDFIFKDNGLSVISFINESNERVSNIFNEIDQLLAASKAHSLKTS